MTRGRLALACGLVVALTCSPTAASVEAALPAAPFALDTSPTAPMEGAPITVSVTPRSGVGSERFDLYVVLASVAQAAFLTPEGAWVARPTPYAQGRSTSEGPLTRQWPKAWPSGHLALALVVVPPGADPLARADWRFRPSIAWIDVAPAEAAPMPSDRGTLGLLALSLGVAITLVWWAGRGNAQHATDPPRARRRRPRDGGR